MKFFGTKTIALKNGYEIHVHFANNRGRGSDNVTLTVVPVGSERHQYTRQYDGYLYRDYTAGWRGNFNVPQEIFKKFGRPIEEI